MTLIAWGSGLKPPLKVATPLLNAPCGPEVAHATRLRDRIEPIQGAAFTDTPARKDDEIEFGKARIVDHRGLAMRYAGSRIALTSSATYSAGHLCWSRPCRLRNWNTTWT